MKSWEKKIRYGLVFDGMVKYGGWVGVLGGEGREKYWRSKALVCWAR